MARRVSFEPAATGLPKWPWRVNLPANVSNSGKRERRFFDTKQEAETFCRQQRTRLDNFGRNSLTLTPGQQEQAAMAFERLAPFGVPLNTAIAEYVARLEAKKKSVTFSVLFDLFVASKRNRSKAYKTALRYTLPRFPGLHERFVSEIEPAHVEDEMKGMTPTVRNAFMRNLRAVFNFGIKRGLLEKNPILKLDFEDVKQSEVEILSINQSRALMTAASAVNELLPYHAIALFAGIRPMELERLDWAHVDLTERHIEIPPAVSKTGRRRIVDIAPNLHAWLAHYVENGGKVAGLITPSANLRTQLRAIRAAAGIGEWVQDVMRHSYASYWLAKHGDINRLTLQMGHESTAMLFRHYNRTSKRKDAAKYWQIKPAGLSASRKVVSFHASAA